MPRYSAYDKADGHSYALGLFPSMELLSARPEQLRCLLVQDLSSPSEGVQKLIALCRQREVEVEEAPKALARISGKDNCFAAAVFEKYDAPLVAAQDHVLLHNPSDTGNVGSILRSALGFGYKNVAIVRPGVDPFDPRVIRASMGAAFHLNIELFDSFDAYRARFSDSIRPYYLFRLRNAKPLSGIRRKSPAPLTLVFGNEAAGLPPELENFGHGVFIEQEDTVDSLNLSVAAGIGLYAFKRTFSRG